MKKKKTGEAEGRSSSIKKKKKESTRDVKEFGLERGEKDFTIGEEKKNKLNFSKNIWDQMNECTVHIHILGAIYIYVEEFSNQTG